MRIPSGLIPSFVVTCFLLWALLFASRPVFAQKNSLFLNHWQSLESISERFPAPEGYTRIPVTDSSFAEWLRALPVQPTGSPVMNYRGGIQKNSQDTTVAAVVAVRIQRRNLDQCMDILMRFRAEFLISIRKKKSIHFPLPDGLAFYWRQWQEGMRPQIKGSQFKLLKNSNPSSTNHGFEQYLRTIFDYSGTQAFYHYYRDISRDSIQIGDFVVKKGAKGHAVLIVDLVRNGSGKFKALIGQGDTPACQFYILKSADGNPWFDINDKSEPLPLPIRKKMTWDGLRRFE